MPSATQVTFLNSQAKPGRPSDAFHRLVEALSNELGPSSGLDSADVDAKRLQCLMQDYFSKESEWKQYAFRDANGTFTRNLVDEGNGKSNLLILVWTPGKESVIHDHANSHCIMKVLQGSLKEILYAWPDRNAINDGTPSPLPITKETTFSEDEVTYISDNLGLHKISNPDPENYAVSLHLYTPPNLARYGCSAFNQKTGAATRMHSSSLFSEMGRLA